MTPNKLPPLPEPAIEITEAGQTSRYFGPVQMHDYADDAIALRQSQSLPAGAVADGPVFYVSRVYDCDAGEDRGALHKTIPANLIGKRVRLVPVDEALQADAREKGEIADLESDIDTLVDHNMALQSAIRDAIKIHSSFGTTADMADWLRDELDALATQPAQASEKAPSDIYTELCKLADRFPPNSIDRVRMNRVIANYAELEEKINARVAEIRDEIASSQHGESKP